eukprot:TRINITY_DN57574_c0_g1_i1.p1 TRINITY_DN57574_c0_g1~~TRINITY_DN57574_c0_g1_i1.p1  ORF type:complete len:311 (-),score=56.31 TRINITY_DN57574_c0_g1_i1:137-946(-)
MAHLDAAQMSLAFEAEWEQVDDDFVFSERSGTKSSTTSLEKTTRASSKSSTTSSRIRQVLSEVAAGFLSDTSWRQFSRGKKGRDYCAVDACAGGGDVVPNANKGCKNAVFPKRGLTLRNGLSKAFQYRLKRSGQRKCCPAMEDEIDKNQGSSEESPGASEPENRPRGDGDRALSPTSSRGFFHRSNSLDLSCQLKRLEERRLSEPPGSLQLVAGVRLVSDASPPGRAEAARLPLFSGRMTMETLRRYQDERITDAWIEALPRRDRLGSV